MQYHQHACRLIHLAGKSPLDEYIFTPSSPVLRPNPIEPISIQHISAQRIPSSVFSQKRIYRVFACNSQATTLHTHTCPADRFPTMEGRGATHGDNVDQEKQAIEYAHVDAAKDNVDNEVGKVNTHDEFTPQEQRKIIRRIDRRLVVTVGAMYCVSLMDRTNMSAANIAGMSVELDLHVYRYVSHLLLVRAARA